MNTVRENIPSSRLNCILLVDDNEFTNIFNRKFLKKHDLADSIYAVKNGQEALDYLTHEGEFAGDKEYPKPDLILLDINMPVMDGWEFLEEFNTVTKKTDLSSCSIVILTTSPNPADEIRARSIIKVADYRIKPITVEMMEEIIQNKFK